MASRRQRPKGTGTLFRRDLKGSWIARWFDHSGRRREASTHTTDKAAAERILAKRVADAAIRRDGVIDAAQDRYIEQSRRTLAEHFAEYDECLRVRIGRKTGFAATPRHRSQRQQHLAAVVDALGWTKLDALDRSGLEAWLANCEGKGLSARTRNTYAISWCAFGNWCVDTGRLVANPFPRLGRANERGDRRRHRRALAGDELRRLIDAARRRPLAEYGRPPINVVRAEDEPQKRSSWTYEAVTPENIAKCEAKARERLNDRPDLVARLEALGRRRALTYKTLVLTGLRLNELRSLTVGMVDLDGRAPPAALAPENEKARRGADIPLRADLAADLAQHLAERMQDAQRDAIRERRPVPARLSADTPLLAISADAIRVLALDLVAAGLAKRVRSVDRMGKPTWKIDKRDERGRTSDMHAFRTTFNSLLAAAGVPLTTRRILMRHAAEGVTDEHYADAKLIDLRGALDQLPALPLEGTPERQAQSATGTDDAPAASGVREVSPRLFPRQLQREQMRSSARGIDGAADAAARTDERKSLASLQQRDVAPQSAKACGEAGEGARPLNVQLGRLLLCLLSSAGVAAGGAGRRRWRCRTAPGARVGQRRGT